MARKSSRSMWAEKLAGGSSGKVGASLPGGLAAGKKSPAKGSGKKLSVSARAAQRGGVNAPAQFSGIVLGIDPSLRGTGLAVIEVRRGRRPRCLKSLTVKNGRELSVAQCIKNIFTEVEALMDSFDISCAAIEQSIYVQNNRVAMILGSARGAAIAAVARKDCEVFEYAPLRIKQAVVGFGRASKQQVSKTVGALIDGAPDPFPYDEADAAGAALAHAFTKGKGGAF